MMPTITLNPIMTTRPIIALVILALVGVLSIWEFLSGDAINKTLGSIAVISFVSLITIGVAKSRENIKA